MMSSTPPMSLIRLLNVVWIRRRLRTTLRLFTARAFSETSVPQFWISPMLSNTVLVPAPVPNDEVRPNEGAIGRAISASLDVLL
jgi:hypothetical protein